MRISLVATLALLATAATASTLTGCASAQPAPTDTTVAASATPDAKWQELHKTHAENLKVHWPDGHVTVGLTKHIGDLKDMFAFAPDAHFDANPVQVANGEWTSTVRVVEGTFTQPMSTNGKSVAPTGKPFKVWVATINHAKDGTVDEEYLYWNNQTLMNQIGL